MSYPVGVGGGTSAAAAKSPFKLCDAAGRGDLVGMRTLIAAGASVNECDDVRQRTPLHSAVRGEHVDCVRELLKHPGIDMGVRWGEEDYWRIRAGEIDSASYVGTPLHSVAYGGSGNIFKRLQIAELLLDHGTDILRTSGGNTAFDVAFEDDGEIEMIRLLFEKRKDVLLHDNKWATLSTNELPHCYAGHDDEFLVCLLAIDTKYNVTYSSEQLVEVRSRRLFRILFEKQQKVNKSETFLFAAGFISRGVSEFLLERGYKAYQVETKTGTLSILLDHSPVEDSLPIVAQYFNEQSSKTAVQRVAHPLHVFLSDPNYFDMAQVLLEAGFDPKNLLWSHDVVPDSAHLCGFPLAVAETFGYRHCTFNAISRAIISATTSRTDGDLSKLQKLLNFLLQRGATIVASSAQEISPLTLLAVKCYYEERGSTPVAEYELRYRQLVASTFLNVLELSNNSSGLDLYYRRPTPFSKPFLCPDVVVAAALLGNTRILSHMVSKTGLNAHHLLLDLLAVVELKFHDNPLYSTAFENKVILITTVGRTTLKLLRYGIKSAPFLHLCADLHEKLATAYDHLTSLPVVEIATQDALWENVFNEFETFDSLQHMCRVQIVNHLLQSKVGGTFGEKLKELDIPKRIRQYLSFMDELEPDAEESGFNTA